MSDLVLRVKSFNVYLSRGQGLLSGRRFLPEFGEFYRVLSLIYTIVE